MKILFKFAPDGTDPVAEMVWDGVSLNEYGYCGPISGSEHHNAIQDPLIGFRTESSGSLYWYWGIQDGQELWLYEGPLKGFLNQAVVPHAIFRFRTWVLAKMEELYGPENEVSHHPFDEDAHSQQRKYHVHELALSLLDIVWVDGSYGSFRGKDAAVRYLQVRRNLEPLFGERLIHSRDRQFTTERLCNAINLLQDEALMGIDEFLYGLRSAWLKDRRPDIYSEMEQFLKDY